MFITHLLSVLGIIFLVGIAGFFELSVILWTLMLGAALILATVFVLLPPVTLVMFWLVFLTAAAFSNLTQVRRKHIVTPMVAELQKQMPPISDTERTAIEAGDTWWEKDLFCGKPDWNKLFSFPKPTLSVEESSFIDHQVEQLCAMINDFDIVSKEKNLPPAAWEFLKKEKFFGLVIPKQYGGLGFSAIAHSTIITKLATRSVTAAVTAMVPNSLGPGELLLHYGTEEQKNYYLPRLAVGDEIPCFALTGPDAGSDAGAIPDKGFITKDIYKGQETLGIRLSWDKRYITLAPVATILGLAIHLYDPEHLISNKEDLGITLCLVPTDHPGVEIGNRHIPMYMAFMNGPTRGENVFIPMDWIIGGQKMIGEGWRMLMECLSIGRSISLPALATGSAKITYRCTGAYSRIRKQFNLPIAMFEGVEEALGYIAGYTYMIDACRQMTAGAIDMKINPSIVSAITKYHLTEMCRHVISHGMDVHGGHTVQVGPRNFLAHIYYSIPISITVEGANILTRNLIIFGQGAIRCHPYILREVELLSAKETDVAKLDQTLLSHIGFFVSNLIRTVVYGWTGGFFIRSNIKNRRIAKYQRQLTRMSTALSLFADTSLILLGGSLKRRERISARLGDMLSHLYVASAVLKYYKDNDEAASDVDVVCWSLKQCLFKIQIACHDLATNFPNRFVGAFLRFLIFPFGFSYKHPKDALHRAVCETMLSPNELRERITKYSYYSKNGSEISGLLEEAFKQVDQVDPLWKQVQKAVQSGMIPEYYDFSQRIKEAVDKDIIKPIDAQQLEAYEKLRVEVIKVNEFNFDLTEVLE